VETLSNIENICYIGALIAAGRLSMKEIDGEIENHRSENENQR